MKDQATKKTDEILNSLDGVKKMKAPDFFYARLKSRMERSITVNAQPNRFLRPAFAVALLALLLILNVVSLLKQSGKSEDNISGAETENVQSITSAYHLDDNLSYELNQ